MVDDDSTGEHPSRRRVLALTGTALATALAGCGGGDGGNDTPTPTPTPTPEPTGAFDIEDQVAEDSIVVTNVSINQPGWIVIWPAAEDGGPALPDSSTERPIAQALVDAGDTAEVHAEPTGFAPPLTEQVDGQETWYAVLHYDDPRDSDLTYPPDDAVVERDGEMVMQSFTASAPGEGTATGTDGGTATGTDGETDTA